MKQIFAIFCSLIMFNLYSFEPTFRDNYECRSTCGKAQADGVEEYICTSEESLKEAKECSRSLCPGKRKKFKAYCVVFIDGEKYETEEEISPIGGDYEDEELEIENEFDFENNDSTIFGLEGIIDEE